MNAGMRLKDSTKKWTRRLAVPMIALTLVASFVTYECVKPAAASAAIAAPSAAPLDVDSVSALLALDKLDIQAAGFVHDIMLYAFLLDADPSGCPLDEQARRR